MRIFWLTTRASLDGPGRVLATLLGRWPEPDDLLVCALCGLSDAFRANVPGPVALHDLRLRGLWDLPALARLQELCRAWGPDVIHTQLSRADWIGRLLGRRLGVPVISTIHNLHSRSYRAEFSSSRARFGLALDRWTAPLASRLIAVSHGVASDLCAIGVSRERVTVVHNGLDARRVASCESREAWRRAWCCNAGDIVVGTVALLKVQKGIRFLVEAARRALGHNPRLRFIHVGGGPLSQELRRLSRAIGIETRFTFLGHVDDPTILLPAFDVFALPSLWEGLPVALLEAMAAGLPCVGTRVSGISELIEDGASGLLVPPAEPEALAVALVALSKDPARRAALGWAAHERVRHFDAMDVAVRYRHVYTELPDRGRPRRRRHAPGVPPGAPEDF